jgi:hypothetical protein
MWKFNYLDLRNYRNKREAMLETIYLALVQDKTITTRDNYTQPWEHFLREEDKYVIVTDWDRGVQARWTPELVQIVRRDRVAVEVLKARTRVFI